MIADFRDMFGTTVNTGDIVAAAVGGKIRLCSTGLTGKNLRLTPITKPTVDWQGAKIQWIRNPKSVVVMSGDVRLSYYLLKNLK